MAKKKVMTSAGHGPNTPGKRTPDGYNEHKFNEAVVDLLNVELKRCGFDVKQANVETTDTPLKTRTDLANSWGADIYVAVHYNALADKWRDGEGGIETYHYPTSTKGKKLATAIHKQLMKGTKMKDRGVKPGNLHEVREPHAPAALVEAGFMDIKREAELMKSAAYQKECAVEIAKGICDYFGVNYKAAATPAPSKPVASKPNVKKEIHRVKADGKQVGAFSNQANITDQVKKELAKGAKKITIEEV